MTQTIDQLPPLDGQDNHDDAFQRAMHRTLTNTESYAKKIHWWIRLFGVLWCIGMVLTACFVAYTLARTTSETSQVRTSAYQACINNPATTLTQCAELYGH